MLDEKIGIIGAGKMGTAIIKGILRAGLVDEKQLVASDPIEALGEALTKETGVRFMRDNKGLLEVTCLVQTCSP